MDLKTETPSTEGDEVRNNTIPGRIKI